jgi:hypothetical protein
MLERTDAGLDVSVNYDPLDKVVILLCVREGVVAFTEVPPEKVRDAFDHPACYLAPEQMSLLNPPRTSVEPS